MPTNPRRQRKARRGLTVFPPPGSFGRPALYKGAASGQTQKPRGRAAPNNPDRAGHALRSEKPDGGYPSVGRRASVPRLGRQERLSAFSAGQPGDATCLGKQQQHLLPAALSANRWKAAQRARRERNGRRGRRRSSFEERALTFKAKGGGRRAGTAGPLEFAFKLRVGARSSWRCRKGLGGLSLRGWPRSSAMLKKADSVRGPQFGRALATGLPS